MRKPENGSVHFGTLGLNQVIDIGWEIGPSMVNDPRIGVEAIGNCAFGSRFRRGRACPADELTLCSDTYILYSCKYRMSKPQGLQAAVWNSASVYFFLL